MDKLVNTLKVIEASAIAEDEEHVLQHKDHDLVYLAEAYATTLFVTEDGMPNFDAIDYLYKKHGYAIMPGERDRFGWVTGVILTKKGLIVFG